jgi:hypothetical protein
VHGLAIYSKVQLLYSFFGKDANHTRLVGAEQIFPAVCNRETTHGLRGSGPNTNRGLWKKGKSGPNMCF